MKWYLVVEKDGPSLVEAACWRLEKLSQDAIKERGRFSIALSGGESPRSLYERLASPAWRDRFDWSNIKIFFSDERAVPPDNTVSNFRAIRESLLSQVPIPEGNVHRWLGETDNLEIAAREYEAQLRALTEPLDVVLLGMGSDGHTASIFPDSPAVKETQRWCVTTSIASLEPHVPRLTLTFPAINRARNVWIYAPGAEKADRVRSVLCDDLNMEEQPVQGVAPEAGELVWMLDEAAAAKLPS